MRLCSVIWYPWPPADQFVTGEKPAAVLPVTVWSWARTAVVWASSSHTATASPHHPRRETREPPSVTEDGRFGVLSTLAR